MHYVMSDLHGCYDKYLQMLEKIGFSDADVLIFLGDAADRGPDGIRVIQDLMGRANVMPLLGNHEDMFRQVIRAKYGKLSMREKPAARRNYVNWTRNNGGDVTWQAFCALPLEQQREIARWLESLPLYYELSVSGKSFLLAHAGVGGYAPEKELSSCGPYDFIWGRMDYDRAYYRDRYLVTGHTPTVLIDPAARGRIWRGNNHVAIDCGAVFFGTLGCLCLETMEEFYV